jgi:malate dehydrogenase (oxaloacetate-decarboxylating)(NADP+)
MKPLFTIAKGVPESQKRIVFCEGEDERVLRALQIVLDEGIAKPILIGRPSVIEHRIEKFGLRMVCGTDIDIVNPEDDSRFSEFWKSYLAIMERKGVTASFAKLEMRRRNTLIGATLLSKGMADGLICGTISKVSTHLKYIDEVIGHEKGANVYGAMSGLILPGRQVFLVDTHVNVDPTAEQLAAITLMAASEMRKLGMTPKVALLSHSNFGSSDAPSAVKMRAVLAILQELAPDLEVDGEMHGDCALDPEIRAGAVTSSPLEGAANLLVLPNIDAANIVSYQGVGTNWYNLVSNTSNAVLNNSPTFSSDSGGCFVFDGTDDYVSFSNPLNQAQLAQVWTVQAWINIQSKPPQLLVDGLASGLWIEYVQGDNSLLYPIDAGAEQLESISIVTVPS